MNFNSGPTVTFSPTSASFPFERKQLSLSLSKQVRVPLESQTNEAPSSFNGIFPKGSLSLSAPHAEIWVQGKQVWPNFLFGPGRILSKLHWQLLIRDRSSTYGTYVNGIRIQHQTLLESGDIVVRGHC